MNEKISKSEMIGIIRESIDKFMKFLKNNGYHILKEGDQNYENINFRI